MSKTRYGSSFLISSFIYFIVGLLSLSLLEKSKFLKKTQKTVIKIAIIHPTPKIVSKKVITPILETPQPMVTLPPKKRKKPKQKQEQKKINKKVIKKSKSKSKPKKIIKRVIKKITPKPKVIPKKIVKESNPIEYTPRPKKVINTVITHHVIVQPRIDKSIEKRAFLNQVRSQIIANKKYSRIALRRHIEGSVKVKFDIMANGSVNNIRFVKGKTILQKSVRKSIIKSFPIPIPNVLKDQLPMYNISVTVHFKIN